MTARVVLATRNPGKLAELRRLIADAHVPVEVLGADDYEDLPEVAETGSTFAQNALLKARAVASATGTATVADDSGLCVDALHGMPGIFSARWAGRHGDDRANIDLLLGQITDVPEGSRGARFLCAAALVLPDGREHVTEGQLAGSLTRAPRGTNGFGYDPVFVPEGETRTAAELSPEAKDAISHRGRALRSLTPVLAALLASGRA